MMLKLPFPPSAFSGHNNGHWRDTNKLVATWRAEAFHLTRNARLACGYVPPAIGDIVVHFAFTPPDNRSDRTNLAGRLKAQIDGIAEALGVNDKRFLPFYTYAEPAKPGWVEVCVTTIECLPDIIESAIKNAGRSGATNTVQPYLSTPARSVSR